jgi:hypothetical protein
MSGVLVKLSLARLGALVLALLAPRAALALDKQGSAHGGQVGGDTKEVNVSGSAMLGLSLYNPTYAARPDNSGLALFRYAGHFDVDLIGRYLSIPIDVNLWTDRQRRKLGALAPSELDLIGGLTSTLGVSQGFDLELGARVETDRPADRGGLTQTYVDARARLLYSLDAMPGMEHFSDRLGDGDVSGYATLGWFAINPSYAARPDNSGIALLRYGLHSEIASWQRHLAFGGDATLFTDRHYRGVIPSELDVTADLIGRLDPFEAHLAYERDMPVDRGGKVQSLLYVLLVWSFDLHDMLHPPAPSSAAPAAVAPSAAPPN